MKIKDLMSRLQVLDPDMECMMQLDAEGDNYAPLHCVDWDGLYIPEENGSGHMFDVSWNAEEAKLSPEAWTKLKKENPRCLVFIPRMNNEKV